MVEVIIKNRVTHPRDFRDFIAIAIADKYFYGKCVNIDTKLYIFIIKIAINL